MSEIPHYCDGCKKEGLDDRLFSTDARLQYALSLLESNNAVLPEEQARHQERMLQKDSECSCDCPAEFEKTDSKLDALEGMASDAERSISNAVEALENGAEEERLAAEKREAEEAERKLKEQAEAEEAERKLKEQAEAEEAERKLREQAEAEEAALAESRKQQEEEARQAEIAAEEERLAAEQQAADEERQRQEAEEAERRAQEEANAAAAAAEEDKAAAFEAIAQKKAEQEAAASARKMADELAARETADRMALAVQNGDLDVLTKELNLKSRELQQTEQELHEREDALRRAREEQALMRELVAIDQLTLRKMKEDESRISRMKLSEEQLQEIMNLEDEIKMRNKETKDLQERTLFLKEAHDKVYKSIHKEEKEIVLVKRMTGYSGEGAYRYANKSDLFKQYQRVLAELEVDQKTNKSVTNGLTKRIEELTAELETCKNIDEELRAAKQMLAQKESEKIRLHDEQQSISRIAAKKERMLETSKPADPYRRIRILEGDKRALHHALLRNIDGKGSNEKSIGSTDARLRQLEYRLESITAYLRDVFDADGESDEHRPPEYVEGDKGVPLGAFEEIQNDLTRSRALIKIYDDRLARLDATIEMNEKKVSILHYAIVSRTNNAARENVEKSKDREMFMEQAESMQQEFDIEYERLVAENDELRRILEVGAPDGDNGNGQVEDSNNVHVHVDVHVDVDEEAVAPEEEHVEEGVEEEQEQEPEGEEGYEE